MLSYQLDRRSPIDAQSEVNSGRKQSVFEIDSYRVEWRCKQI